MKKQSELKYISCYPGNWVDNKLSQAWVLLHHWFSKNLLWTLSIWVGKIYQACLESRVCQDNNMSGLWSQQCILADKSQWRGTTVFAAFSVTFHWTMGIFLSWLWPNCNPEVPTTPSLKIPFIPGRLRWLNFVYLQCLAVTQRHGVLCCQWCQMGIREAASTAIIINMYYIYLVFTAPGI